MGFRRSCSMIGPGPRFELCTNSLRCRRSARNQRQRYGVSDVFQRGPYRQRGIHRGICQILLAVLLFLLPPFLLPTLVLPKSRFDLRPSAPPTNGHCGGTRGPARGPAHCTHLVPRPEESATPPRRTNSPRIFNPSGNNTSWEQSQRVVYVSSAMYLYASFLSHNSCHDSIFDVNLRHYLRRISLHTY